VQLQNPRAFILSRCAWTLYNFRRSLAREFEKKDIEVALVGAGEDGYDDRLIEEGFDFRTAGLIKQGLAPLSDLRLFFQFRGVFRREAPLIVHSFTIKPAIYGTLAAWMAGVPVRIVTITGLGHVFTSGNSVLRRFVQSLYRIALARADIVFFQNSEDRELFLERGLVQARKVRMVAGSGVDLARFKPAKLPCVDGYCPNFVMIARLLREKGVPEFVAAAAAVKAQFPEARFRLVGGIDPLNPSGLTASEFASVNAENAVEWVGEVSDVRPYIAEADVVVLPSHREGVPRSLLEGAAMGRALVATDAVGCREVVKDNVTGYLVPVRNIEALAGVMIHFIKHPAKIAEMGQAAQRMVETRFDERKVIEETLAVYEELLAQKGIDDTTPTSRAQ